jgi:dTDP-4-dehydrorhamnose reductase
MKSEPGSNGKSREIVLAIGGSGLVGSYLIRQLSDSYRLYVTYHSLVPKIGNLIEIDLSDPHTITKVLERIQPTIIINLAAYTDVDGCEKNREYALRINAKLPRIIAHYIKYSPIRKDSPFFLHISTDYVFDGKTGHYTEESNPSPINWYGRTKLLGEQEIAASLDVDKDAWCIARLSTPYGIHPKRQSFPVFTINRIRDGLPVRAVTDQFTSPSYSRDVAFMLLEVIRRRLKSVIHVASLSRLSRYEQAIRIAEEFNLNKELVHACSSDSMNWLAERPKDSSLNVTKALNTLSYKPRGFHESVRDFAFEYAKANRAQGM